MEPQGRVPVSTRLRSLPRRRSCPCRDTAVRDRTARRGRTVGAVDGSEQMEETARRRLRTLRQASGWTLDDLAARSHVGASTISRIETGQRRLALDQLVTLARALGVTVDDLLADDDAADVVIRPTASGNGGASWVLSRRDDPSGRVVAKQRIPAGTTDEPERKVHPGRDWFYVLDGTSGLSWAAVSTSSPPARPRRSAR